jgi:hypothetical protein
MHKVSEFFGKSQPPVWWLSHKRQFLTADPSEAPPIYTQPKNQKGESARGKE